MFRSPRSRFATNTSPLRDKLFTTPINPSKLKRPTPHKQSMPNKEPLPPMSLAAKQSRELNTSVAKLVNMLLVKPHNM